MADNTPLQDYMNPKASMTLGAASAMVIAFTTTLSLSFNLPQPITAICLSALFAFLQIAAAKDVGPLAIRAVYFIIVTLVIFSAARGGNSTLADGESVLRTTPAPTVSLIATAYAVDATLVSTNESPGSTNAPPELSTVTNKPPQVQLIFQKW